MALQSVADIAMLGLGIRGDVPPDALQPQLADGVHLRWAFGAKRAFPWYGYYLFRRPHWQRELRCLRDLFEARHDDREANW